MKYQLYMNASKNYRWLLFVISEWFSWNELIFLRSELMLQLSEFLWTPRSSVGVFFINFILIDATNRSKTRSDQKPLFFAVSLYPLSFFGNTLFKSTYLWSFLVSHPHICDLSLYLSTELWSLLVLHPHICDRSLYLSTELWSLLVSHPHICDRSLYYIHISVIVPCITSTDLWSFLVLHL